MVQFGTLAIVVTAASILVKEILAQYAFYIARKTGNLSVKADGWHHRSDALSSVVVLAGILFANLFANQLWWIDSVLGAIIAIMLFYTALAIIKESITKLLGEEPSADLTEKISDEARAVYPHDMCLHHFHMHNYIQHQELTFHIRLDRGMSIEAGHAIASEIEDRIKEKYGIMATIHVEPLLA
jgi:cation diffusion facilitator family transporter